MKNKILQNMVLCLAGFIILCPAGCYYDIYDIKGVPEQATAWTPLWMNAHASINTNYLGAVSPSVSWIIRDAGTTQAKKNGNYLLTLSPGVVVISATAGDESERFSKNFKITVLPALDEINVLGTELVSHNANTADNPVFFKVKLNLEDHWKNLLNMLIIADRFVNLDLTESTGTQIPGFDSRLYNECNKVLSIALPESIASIGSYAFSCYGNGLSSVSMGNNVLNIMDYAFYDCNELTDIVIPGSVTSIGDYAFSNCNSLSDIVIPDSVTNIGQYAFANCNKLASIILSDSVTSISNNTFYNCTELTSIIIPRSVTSIGSSAFGRCISLTGIVIPESVTSIGNSAFYNCNKLAEIVIPGSVTSIGHNVFGGCSNLAAIDVSPDNEMYSSLDGILYDKEAASLIHCPGGKTGIINIPDTVTSIENLAFSGCRSLTSVIMPDTVTSIDNSAFSGCTGLTGITIPGSVARIGNSAFSGCTGLTGITIPDGVTSIGEYAFSNCSSLASVIIGKNVETIEEFSFSDCNKLTTVTFNCSMAQNGFNDRAFIGDLRLLYFAKSGGQGTYTRKIGSNKWSKN